MHETPSDRRWFRFGHVPLSVYSKTPALLRLVGDWMQDFEVAPRSTKDGIRLALVGYESNERVPFVLPAAAKLLFAGTDSEYYDYRQLWIILLKSATVIADRSRNKLVALTHYNDLRHLAHLEDFMHPVLELLRQNGVYACHTAAVSCQGRGLLLAGRSGQGKSTLVIDLFSHGFDLLSDDRCFLRAGDGSRVEAIGYYQPIRYFPDNVAHVTALQDAIQAAQADPLRPRTQDGKYHLDLRTIAPQRVVAQSALAGLIFPHYSPHERSRLEPMAASEALITILPLTLVCFDRVTSATHFNFCATLTSRLPAARLVMGHDRERWHSLIKQFLHSIPAVETIT